jgi:pimeloyl-ACP methyl ester carboxylesterase
LLRVGFRRLSAASFELSARCAERLFRTPPRHALLPREKRALKTGEFRWLPFRGGQLATWTFGRGPLVLAVHGWGGHGGRLSTFFAPLVDAGFSVVTFDAPSHGGSSGDLAALPDFVDAIEAIAANRGSLAGIVAHSLGATAAGLAIRRGLDVSGAVLLAPPADPETYAGRFARYLHIPKPVCGRMKERLLVRYATRWDDLRLTERFAADDRDQPGILIFHDRRDCRVPWKDGSAVADAWPGARLVTTRGLGHHKILRDPAVIAGSIAFLAASIRDRRASAFESPSEPAATIRPPADCPVTPIAPAQALG